MDINVAVDCKSMVKVTVDMGKFLKIPRDENGS